MTENKMIDQLDIVVAKRMSVLIQAIEDYIAAVEVREKNRKETILALQVPIKEKKEKVTSA